MSKVTTNELLDMWLDVEEQLIYENDDLRNNALGLAQQKIMSALMDKVDNIDLFILSLDAEIEKNKAQQEVYNKEIERIRKKVKSREKLKKHLNNVLIPSIIKAVGKDGKLKTSTANYTLYTGWTTPIYDPVKIDAKYKSIQEKEVIDVKTMKKDAIAAQKEGQYIIGCIVPSEDRIRRS